MRLLPPGLSCRLATLFIQLFYLNANTSCSLLIAYSFQNCVKATSLRVPFQLLLQHQQYATLTIFDKMFVSRLPIFVRK